MNSADQLNSSATAAIFRAKAHLSTAGLAAGILVRDLGSGAEIGIDTERRFPLASLVKVPLALAVLQDIEIGRLDPDQLIMSEPHQRLAGPTGLSRFRGPVQITLPDLVFMAVTMSDNAAGELLFSFCPPERINQVLGEYGVSDVVVRHTLAELQSSIANILDEEQPGLVLELAINSETSGQGHVIRPLDINHANIGSARSVSNLLQMIHSDGGAIGSQLMKMLRDNALRRRLAPHFESDATSWSSKNGTFLNLRHEAGIAKPEGHPGFVVTVLSASSIPAYIQPLAEHALGLAARELYDYLRARTA
ncbi:beta-lactamase regulatory protein [Renibacterium salmoninarum ATCC 33209]|uniref:Beta-lactamase regulatory protein n=1 Tax=Renibacterium salmoninarum (strain ATCC 33209 / DSM 20767 / JCM 11484 / NBRC 15589 / NCIMB 2235) TaxID=288705 RepID=A9WLU0_RENSM|nr:serine hydrolase [Renibacterium salmoninarum]ABY21966.1 beta-lactamase regulatory protein [Renibacterium salmoninarum ATCC 33209]